MIELQKIEIVKANNNDADILTEIGFSAKKHWNYPDNYYEIWKDELTITDGYVGCGRYKSVVITGDKSSEKRRREATGIEETHCRTASYGRFRYVMLTEFVLRFWQS